MEVLDAVAPINQFLCDLHGPTNNIARTMGWLVPFPDAVASLPDADLLDLSLSVKIDPASPGMRDGRVRASARYATSARVSQIEAFYREQFDQVAPGPVESTSTFDGSIVSLSAMIAFSRPDPACGATEAKYHVEISETRGYRAVKVTVRYGQFAYGETFARFACWHNGDAPVPAMSQPTGIEISTFATARMPSTLGLYSTHYFCDRTPHSVRRASVDKHIRDMGWGYREPREGILFMRDGAFEAETHVSGDEGSSLVTFVGEFQLR